MMRLDKKTVWLGGVVFVTVFLGIIAGPGLIDRLEDGLNRPRFGQVTQTVDASFEPYVPEPGETEAQRVAKAAAQRQQMDRLAQQISAGTVPEDLISEGADDAPGHEGDYYYTRFDPVEGPFVRDIPPMGEWVVCFSGRVNGKSEHVVVRIDKTGVKTRDPDTLNGWVFSNCSDGLRFQKQRLSTRAYLKMRLSLLPEDIAYEGQRVALKERLKAAPWSLW